MDRYIPNQVPGFNRWWNFALSMVILSWGICGVWANDLPIPISKRGVLHLSGAAAHIMLGAMVAAALNLLSILADHYGIRNNELSYRRFAFVTQVVGWSLFAVAILFHVLPKTAA